MGRNDYNYSHLIENWFNNAVIRVNEVQEKMKISNWLLPIGLIKMHSIWTNIHDHLNVFGRLFAWLNRFEWNTFFLFSLANDEPKKHNNNKWSAHQIVEWHHVLSIARLDVLFFWSGHGNQLYSYLTFFKWLAVFRRYFDRNVTARTVQIICDRCNDWHLDRKSPFRSDSF